jgi:hypothetical protein
MAELSPEQRERIRAQIYAYSGYICRCRRQRPGYLQGVGHRTGMRPGAMTHRHLSR